ncbi:MAG: phenylacetic acid degradation protein [Rhizorhabdus sp.]|nr:phenylacetic acid degradation protein [Rhizorhabdus sp.]
MAYCRGMEDDFDFEKVKQGLGGHSGAIGLRHVGHGDDWAEIAIDYDPRLIMDETTGVMASGAIISLIDVACGAAIIARGRGLRPMATLDLRVDYMRAAKPGRTVTARGTCYRLARSVAFVRCEAHDGDPADLVAHASGSFIFTTGV